MGCPRSAGLAGPAAGAVWACAARAVQWGASPGGLESLQRPATEAVGDVAGHQLGGPLRFTVDDGHGQRGVLPANALHIDGLGRTHP